MAFTLRGTTEGYGALGAGTSVTVTLPTGTQAGDLAFVQSYTYADDFAEPSGFTECVRTCNSAKWHAIHGKLVTADDVTAGSWTFTLASNRQRRWVCATYYGDFDGADPFQAVGTVTKEVAYAYRTALEIIGGTTDAANTISLLFAAVPSTSEKTFTPPAGYTEHYDTGDTDSDYWQTCCGRVYPDADTDTGTLTLTLSGSAFAYEFFGVQILLNPASGSEPEADVTVTITPADATADGETATITGQMNPTVTLTPGDALADGTDVYVVFWADWTEHTAGGVTWTPMTATAPTWSNAVSSSAAWLRRY